MAKPKKQKPIPMPKLVTTDEIMGWVTLSGMVDVELLRGAVIDLLAAGEDHDAAVAIIRDALVSSGATFDASALDGWCEDFVDQVQREDAINNLRSSARPPTMSAAAQVERARDVIAGKR